MEPKEFCNLASELANSKSPAKLRTAISRAYYSAFHVGCHMLSNLGFPISTGPGGHGELCHRLLFSDDPDVKKAGSNLNDLRSKRIEADYKLSLTKIETPQTAQSYVRISEKVISNLESCMSDPNRLEVVKKSVKKFEIVTKSKTFK